MAIACSGSPALRYSLASGAKYRRGFSWNFCRNSSIRRELCIFEPRWCSVPGASGAERLKIPRIDEWRQCEVSARLAFTPSEPVVFEVLLVQGTTLKNAPSGVIRVLQSMRSSAKYIWIFLIIFFVGGFLLAETSGLLGRSPVTTSTAVATVNGEDILAVSWFNATQTLEQQATQQSGRTLSLDDRQRLKDQAFEELVDAALLRQEYKRRGIVVADEEIADAARSSPPPQLMQSPELQTNGQFDPEKYQRYLASPAARQEGLLLQLEAYYRDAIPREKLFQQVASDVYVSDARLWQAWKDTRDTAQISYVAFRPEMLPDTGVVVPDNEIAEYYEKNKTDFERPARATVSVLAIPRAVSPADSAAVRTRILGLRDRIAKGEKFEDVAKSESADSASGAAGGSLGKGVRGRFVPQFEDAAFALNAGELSQPVLTPFGYHLIKVDEKKGDSISIRHILLRIQQSDSAATRSEERRVGKACSCRE